jgi:predicted negative regulator of RcsB-dependent stress response
MAYDLEEQEQLASLKAWWSQYGNLLTWLLIIGLGSYAAWASWNNHVGNQAAQASLLYEEINKAVVAKDYTKVQRAATDMEDKFSRTIYAQMAAMAAAKSAFDANDFKTAKGQLQWAIDKGNNDEYVGLAKIRLAGILLDEKAYDEGLKLLSGDFPAAFAAIVADRKGDILIAQNKVTDARAAYQLALDKMELRNPGRQLIQLKLDAIGGATTKATS